MAATGYEAPVMLKLPGVRTAGTLVGEAYPIDAEFEGIDRTALGVVWNAPTCRTILAGGSECTTQSVLPNPVPSGLTEARQPAFSIWDALQCSSLSRNQDFMRSIIEWRMDAIGSAAIAAELISGAASGGAGLNAGTALAAGANAGAAIGLVEEALGALTRMGNGLGMVHMNVKHLTAARSSGAVVMDDEGWRTPAGHTVVADAGYPSGTIWGSGPVGLSASTLDWLSPPQGQLTLAVGQGMTDSQNIMQHLASKYAVLAFNPCLVVKSAVTA